MVQEITTPVVLAHKNIVPGTEVVTVPGSDAKLVRNADYIMDYTNGELRFLSSGVAVALGSLIEENGINVNYSYAIDFKGTPNLFESQIEVYSEVASRASEFVVSVKNTPIVEVSRIINLTTQEEYTPTAINNSEITFSGASAPRLLTLPKLTTTQTSIAYNPDRNTYVKKYSINYPSTLTPKLNPITSILDLQSNSQYPRVLIIGGLDALSNTLEILVSLETSDIALITGGRSLRTSTTTLIQNVDYSFILTSVPGILNTQKMKITFNPSGTLKIRTNNLYASFIFNEQFSEKDAELTVTCHPVNDAIYFNSNNTQVLASLFQQSTVATDAFDKAVWPDIQVINPSTGEVFVSGRDYEINLTQKTITKLPYGSIQNKALVSYLEQRSLSVGAVVMRDVVLVDYVWGSNSINWSALQKTVPITIEQKLYRNQQFITLTRPPIDESQILIYLQTDSYKKSQATSVYYDRTNQRLQITPIATSAKYVIEYNTVDQPIPENTPYYVSYSFGATRNRISNLFAPLFGLTNAQTEREEVFSMRAGQSSIQLSRAPTSLETIEIYNADDSQKTVIASANRFDNITGTLHFTPIAVSGRKIVKYLTLGFDTNSLRNVIARLFSNFTIGPTELGYRNLIAGFVDTPAVISSGLNSRFVLPDKKHSQGSSLKAKEFETSPSLEDGTPSITYLPARFNLGAVLESSRGSYVKVPVASNLGLQEGTLEFLTGILFNPNDRQLHYFVDVMGSHPRKNRFSLYKNINNQLNFDIWDNKENLYRMSIDVSQIYYTEIINLKAGDDTATLKFAATPAQLTTDGTTPDLYLGLETKFIIMPDTNTYPSTFKKASIPVISFDPPTKTIKFKPVQFSGRYVFSYVTGLVKYEETDNFVAITWKLHTKDGKPPFYKLYLNGVDASILGGPSVQTLEQLATQLAAEISTEANTYDNSQYDEAIYKPKQD